LQKSETTHGRRSIYGRDDLGRLLAKELDDIPSGAGPGLFKVGWGGTLTRDQQIGKRHFAS